ncbi:MAG: hypothetical protein V3R81_14105 [Gammaproteobacteria bacterium]
MSAHAEGDLRVWWIPQVPMEPFEVLVSSIAEGRKIIDVLADYDIFQFEKNVKPDYCNTGGLARWECGEWCDVDDDEEDVKHRTRL